MMPFMLADILGIAHIRWTKSLDGGLGRAIVDYAGHGQMAALT
jgi:hypothetical protein